MVLKTRIRRLGAAALAAGALLAGAAAMAQDNRGAVRMVVPFGAGTTTDTVGRIVGEGLGRNLQQTLVVDNRAGAGGSTGTELVARSAADGRTLVMGTVGTHAINAALFSKLPYDPLRDFAPIAFIGYTPTLLVVAADSPIKSLKDLTEAAARPAGVSFASAGNGTSGHLAGELLAQRLGGRMLHVPYKEGAMALTSVMASQVDFMFYHPAAVMPQIKAGKLRALGSSGALRSAAASQVPTLMEQGIADFDLVAWFMLYAPVATPAAALAQLRTAAAAALAQPELMTRLREQGVEPGQMRAEDLQPFNQKELVKWAGLVKRSGAQVD
ncbi:Bug family tripartite tricarboxylate transporter substrate binding protein [Variovorax saccharolyticus]|uniref:Bug family tripartite tricarboxylate transporter substrate binding protein n=1 Tax=Variovorax saccharolyticus TaxID=3053516 RepID=UPI002576BD13|nr:tripartite tricarboxylate transporter substrate binding protein [Variovorax sp. J31P216]MDM0025350.1 tripartite tricarboxylate transporter substrate binding protein [Variovorax sp. J31P216]